MFSADSSLVDTVCVCVYARFPIHTLPLFTCLSAAEESIACLWVFPILTWSLLLRCQQIFFSVCGDEGVSGIQNAFFGPEAILLY